MKKNLFSILFFLASCAISANLVPDYEVKFLLDPNKSLFPNSVDLQTDIINKLGIQEDVDKIKVVFLDTDNKDFDSKSWSARMRRKNDKDKLEITYKKRYSIASQDLDTINNTLNLASIDGFDASATAYAAQIEYGYNKMTLSFSNNKNYSGSLLPNSGLPSLENAKTIMIEKIPGKLKDANGKNWGINTLNKSRFYGEIVYTKYTAYLDQNDNTKLAIEVWPIKKKNGAGVDYIVEASFKAEDFITATQKRDMLKAKLENLGILLPNDGLKTQLILERY